MDIDDGGFYGKAKGNLIPADCDHDPPGSIGNMPRLLPGSRELIGALGDMPC